MSKEVTFVTSFVDIYESTFEDKTVDWRFNKFKDLAETGIKICVYVSPECYIQLAEFIQPYPNVRIMKQFRIPDTLAAKACVGIDFSLPERRNMPKDVPEYMHLINSKPEFMYDTIQKNPWGSTHFAWIDFSISYVFHKKPETFEYLKVLSKRTFTSEPFLVVPGCWDKLPPVEAAQISNSVYWRFCGGFLLGDAGSIIEFYNLYNQFYPEFLRTHRKLVWEVNFWGWLEANGGWSPRWYSADHNDSIIKTPVDIYTVCIKDDLSVKTYPYPQIETYEPMQASYIVYNDQHILNTRYVNYWYLESGHCHIKHPEDFIISKNLCSRLDPETLMPVSINDKEFSEMSEESVGLASKRCYFYGLEDIRLYEHGGKLKFIATNIDYSPTGSNRMIVGEYHPETLSYSNCRITEPPYESWCEKNWIPIKSPVSDENQGQDQAEHFIYKWFPMEIGRLDPETYKLNIVKTYPILAPEFHRARGSTRFIDNGEYLVGLVHLSECTLPRRYYHIMVALDRETLRPIKYSETFCFLHIGIEFCIGFDIRGGEYVFWISTWDRNPMMVRLPIDKLVLKYDF